MSDKEHVLVCVMAESACVDGDTEFFTGTEWKKISNYNDEDMVLQYCPETGIANLTDTVCYIKKPCSELWNFKTKNTDQCYSANHIVPYDYTDKSDNRHPKSGTMNNTTMQELMDRHNNNITGFRGKFRTVFTFSGSGISLSDNEIRLMIAVIADGSFNNKTTRCSFHIKKDRKKERLRMLCELCNIPIKETEDSIDGYTNFRIYAPIRIKQFPIEWYNCTKHQFEIIWDEYKYWDAYFADKEHIPRYNSNNKSDADFMQFVAAVNGYRATIHCDDRVGQEYKTNGKTYVRKSITYDVTFSPITSITIAHGYGEPKTTIQKIIPDDGYQYCFTVPSEYLVLRRNDKIFITHNCGKDSVVSKICELTGWTQLVSYTTRPRRENEGYTHVFVTENEYEEMRDASQVAAYTNINSYHYWSTVDQLYEHDFYVIDPSGVKTLRELNLPNLRIITVYINIPEDVRKERAKARGDNMDVYRSRSLSEREQFRNMKRNCDFDYAIPNNNLATAVSVLKWICNAEGVWKNHTTEESV